MAGLDPAISGPAGDEEIVGSKPTMTCSILSPS